MPGRDERRFGEVLELLTRIADGDLSARGEVSSERDEWDGIIAALNMLTENLAAERDARTAAEERLRDAVDAYENAPGLFCSVDLQTLTIVRCNQTLADVLGHPKAELIGRSFADFLVEADRDEGAGSLVALGEGRAPKTPELSLLRVAADPIRVALSGSVEAPEGGARRLRLILRDVTEERRLENQLHQSQRMEAVGRLAGGVAHDFNNLITVIRATVALASAAAEKAGIASDLEDIDRAASRAAELTQQLLVFSRRHVAKPRVVDLVEAIERTERLLKRTLGEDVELRSHHEPALWPVRIDPAQVEQVLINLAVNARDAMENGGTLSIRTANVEVDADTADEIGIAAGPYALLVVSDDGIGMEPKVLEHVFEPFFTTKPRGRGTGLGLATCYGIVKQAGGAIRAISKAGVGSRFEVYLPKAAGAAEENDVLPRTRRAAGRGERLLLAEDDPLVRPVVRRILESAGYVVTEAHDARSAIAAAEASDAPFDLLITDVIMPDLGGPQLAEKLTAQKLVQGVLFVTGYADELVARHGVLDPDVDLLAKPFVPDRLLARVRELLDRETGPSGS